MGNGDRVNRTALWAMVVLGITSSWYPFALDLPKRLRNTAVQLPDGAWDLDGGSRVVARAAESAAALLAQQQFSITVEARPAIDQQSGPARLVSIGRDPYGASLMLGIDRRTIVLYLPCHGAASNADAAWQFPMPSTQDVAVTLWFGEGAAAAPSIQVGDWPRARLDNRCPAGSWAGVPDMTEPWALGNVYSGHRPFAGRILKLELAMGERRIDLLREVPWQAPEVFWTWPERLYERPTHRGTELVAAGWHFANFAFLGYLAAASGRRRRLAHLIAATFVFALILIGGKVFVAGRHPDMLDLLLNTAGAVVGIYGSKRYVTMNKSISPTGQRLNG